LKTGYLRNAQKGTAPGLLRGSFFVSPQAGLPGSEDGLGPVGNLELVKDGGDVVADRFGADEETVGDLGVLEALGDEVEDLTFPVAEFRERLRRGGRADLGEEVHEPDGYLRAENGLAVAHGPDRAASRRSWPL
jgi:hypothetical protein